MLSAIRKQLNPATVMAFVALVFATTGGAFAVTGRNSGGSPARASAARTGSTSAMASRAKAKSKTGLRGSAGPRGATGAAGSAGPAGPAGATGPVGGTGPQGSPGNTGEKGETGKAGEPGAAGAKGRSAIVTEEKPGGSNCKEGGSTVEQEGSGKKIPVCNGSPWTAGGTLPPGKSETGVIAWAGAEGDENKARLPISFTIPLAAALPATQVFFDSIEVQSKENTACEALGEPERVACETKHKEIETACPGKIEERKALPGNLCVYEESSLATSPYARIPIRNPEEERGGSVGGAGRSGAFLIIQFAEGTTPFINGVWIVTAPEAG
jgi:hypothetical protein